MEQNHYAFASMEKGDSLLVMHGPFNTLDEAKLEKKVESKTKYLVTRILKRNPDGTTEAAE